MANKINKVTDKVNIYRLTLITLAGIMSPCAISPLEIIVAKDVIREVKRKKPFPETTC